MKVKITYSEIWRISWPIMLSSLASTIINFTDVAFVARIGEKELAASAIGGVFYFILLMIGAAIGIGAQILMARKAGEGDAEKIGIVFDNSLFILTAFSVLMMLLLYLLVPCIINKILVDPLVAQAAVSYLKARSWSFPLMMVLINLRSFYTGITLTRVITYSTVIMMLLNVLFNYSFVMGGFGFSKMGIFGSGLASAISETIAVLYAVAYTLLKPSLKKYKLFNFASINKEVIWRVLLFSAPLMLQNLLSMGAWFMFFVLIEKIGSRELAVSNVLRSIYMVLMTPVWGFSQASNSMVSNLLGQKKIDAVIPLVIKITKMSLAIGITGILTSIIFKDELFNLVSADVNLIPEAANSFYIVCLGTLVFSVAMVFLSAISGTGQTTHAMIIEIISVSAYLIYVIVFTLFIPSSLEVVWASELLYWLMMLIIGYFYLVSRKWEHKKLI